jgi:hypothetical protein
VSAFFQVSEDASRHHLVCRDELLADPEAIGGENRNDMDVCEDDDGRTNALIDLPPGKRQAIPGLVNTDGRWSVP